MSASLFLDTATHVATHLRTTGRLNQAPGSPQQRLPVPARLRLSSSRRRRHFARIRSAVRLLPPAKSANLRKGQRRFAHPAACSQSSPPPFRIANAVTTHCGRPDCRRRACCPLTAWRLTISGPCERRLQQKRGYRRLSAQRFELSRRADFRSHVYAAPSWHCKLAWQKLFHRWIQKSRCFVEPALSRGRALV